MSPQFLRQLPASLPHCISRCWCHSPINCCVSWPPSPFNGGRQSYCQVRSRPQVTSGHMLLGSLTISQFEAGGGRGKGQGLGGAAVKAESGHLNLYAAFNVFADPQLSASIKPHAVSLSSQESVMLFFCALLCETVLKLPRRNAANSLLCLHISPGKLSNCLHRFI